MDNVLEWVPFYKELRMKHGIVTENVARGLDVSFQTVQNFRKAAPKKREQVIMLAAMLGFDVFETDRLLLSANYHRLYALDAEDATWMFLLNKDDKAELAKYPKAVFDRYMVIYYAEYGKEYKEKIRDQHVVSVPALNTRMARIEIDGHARTANNRRNYSMAKKYSSESVEDEYLELISTLTFAFDHGNRKLVRLIQIYFGDYNLSANEHFQHYKKFLGRYYDNMNSLVMEHIVPNRLFLLALGMHLDLDEMDMNDMLEKAGYPTLNKNNYSDKKALELMEAADDEDKSLRDYLKENMYKYANETNQDWKKVLKQFEYNE